jgi:hypothetical protein
VLPVQHLAVVRVDRRAAVAGKGPCLGLVDVADGDEARVGLVRVEPAKILTRDVARTDERDPQHPEPLVTGRQSALLCRAPAGVAPLYGCVGGIRAEARS